MPRTIVVCLALVTLVLLWAGCKEETTKTETETGAAPSRVQSAAVARKLSAAQRLARSRQNDPAAQMALATLAYEQGAYNDAYRAYRRAVELEAGNYEALVGLARTNLKLQNPTEGLDWLLRAQKVKPGNRELTELQARLLLINGDFDESVTAFRKAIAIEPRRTTTWLNLASAYSLMNRTSDAVATARQAARIDPRDPAPHFALGRHLERAGDKSSAETEYRTALQLDDGNAAVMIALARLLMGQNRRLEEARQLAVKASQIRTDRADAAVIAAWIMHLQGDDRKAANELIKLVNASPQNPEAWEKLSVILKRIGKPTEAAEADRMAKRFIPQRRGNADLQMLDTTQ